MASSPNHAAPGRYVTENPSPNAESTKDQSPSTGHRTTPTASSADQAIKLLENSPQAGRYVDENHVPQARSSDHLFLWSAKTQVRMGDEAVLFARSTNDCHLTLINVDPEGQATVLFPNDLSTKNFLKAGREVRVPSVNDRYRLTFDTAGTETFIGICMGNDVKNPPGIKHRFAAQRFTALGPWIEYVKKAEVAEKEWLKPRRKKLRRKKKKGRRKSRKWIYTTVTRPALRKAQTTLKVVVEP